MIFLKSFSLLFRTGPLHQRRVLSYHTAFLVSTGFYMFFDMGLSWCVIMVGMTQRFPRFPNSGFPLFRFPYTVCLTTYEKDFSLRSK